MARVYVSLGTNVERERHLLAGLDLLEAALGDLLLSSLYETEAVGFSGPAFFNLVAGADTDQPPESLVATLRSVEARCGRRRGAERNASRTLDLDLLLHGTRCVEEPGLLLPHPRLHERGFVLEPLCDLAPDLVHPVLDLTVAELARRVRDPQAVRRASSRTQFECDR